MKMKIAAAALLLAVIQLVPVSRRNPPVESDLVAPPEVKTVLRRACYDCHSHETVWPWYSRVAPVSWLVAHDVNEARSNMNFSRWDPESSDDIADNKNSMIKMLRKDEMPPLEYQLLHPEARLTVPEKNLLIRWAQSRP